jgi:hypothetical protein
LPFISWEIVTTSYAATATDFVIRSVAIIVVVSVDHFIPSLELSVSQEVVVIIVAQASISL